MRNSQNFGQGGMMMVMPHHSNHNKSMIDDQQQKWLMTSADSDQLNPNFMNSKSFMVNGNAANASFDNYPAHLSHSVN